MKQDRGGVGQLLNESLVWLPNSSGQGCRTHRHYSTCKQKIQVTWRGPGGVKPEGKTSLIEDHMARDDDALSGHVEAAVPLVGRGIAKKNTSCGARGEFVVSRGGQVRITNTQRYVSGSTREVCCRGEYKECRGEQRSMDACSEGMWLWRAPQPSTEQACVHGGASCS